MYCGNLWCKLVEQLEEDPEKPELSINPHRVTESVKKNIYHGNFQNKEYPRCPRRSHADNRHLQQTELKLNCTWQELVQQLIVSLGSN